ncbi:hypothetical protein BKE30_08705 [Alkanindiges hydrocarboniclasticus]|uniref:DUF2726 domain-containing protein n=1 Tax=Alkanindiges hydrocarboniclasticus TaxID=1907941 RepID=A0A1S8CV67_9GAMM|nr:DUF2726 domain-containing protein [Alkanindiges hydrocarboniclasticus]ONG39841.1 hypothetical protein BKE30_08705 [Alkanindiges hydrocarboniclasticus]
MSLWWIIGIAIFIVLIALASKNRKPKQQHTPIHAKAILTRREQQFFQIMQQALPRAYIFPQVSFSAILTTKGFYTRSQFNRKIADFVLCDQNLNIVAIIELDDSSHKGREQQDAARDAMLNEAGYAVIRYAQIPSSAQLQKDLHKYLR